MTELLTPVTLPPQPRLVASGENLLLLGSCFAQEVGQRLVGQMPSGCVTVNPFGPLYSPSAIAQTLRWFMMSDGPELVFEGRDGQWHSWLASSVCSASTEAECRERVTLALKEGRLSLQKADTLILTFGTTRHYILNEEWGSAAGTLVANCHKELSTGFREEEPALSALVEDWSALIQTILNYRRQYHGENRQSLQIILTVSPYRYRKYGFHTSQLQKAKLLLLCEELQNHFAENAEGVLVSYFPSYEILLDELRDYRFYATDMLHPSNQAVDIITERFRQWAFTPQLLREADELLRERRRQQHRPILSTL